MTYPMCPSCRRADIDVQLARDVREPCPHCGGVLIESLRACCVPECRHVVPVAEALPVCRSCGIKIALAYHYNASLHDAVRLEQRREREAREEAKRNGRAETAVVYYVRLDDERIKIGFTSRLRDRVRAFRVHPSALLACEPGGRDLERERHAQFAAERISSRIEEFAPSERLLSWIEAVRAERGLPAWAKIPDTRVVRRTA